MTSRIVLAAIAAVLIGLVAARYRDLQDLDDVTLARRLLESRGIACTPKIVERQEAQIHIVCADGKYDFVHPLPCGTVRPILCDILGFDAACWERVAPLL